MGKRGSKVLKEASVDGIQTQVEAVSHTDHSMYSMCLCVCVHACVFWKPDAL